MKRHLAPEVQAVIDFVETVSDDRSHIAFDGLRVLQHPDRLLQFLTGMGVDIIPVTVELWPSLSCDARCPTCPYRLSGARDLADNQLNPIALNTDIGKGIIADLASSGVESVIFTGGGEPLLNPNILRLAQAVRTSGLSWAIFTNGRLLSRSLGKQLLELEPSFLRVSLDAGSPEQYSRIYGVLPAEFEEVLQNVWNTAEEAQKLGTRRFGLGFTLEPGTKIDELRSIRALLQDLISETGGLGLVAFRPRLIHYRGDKPLCPQPRREGFEDLAEAIQVEVVKPLIPLSQSMGVKMDVKTSLFRLAASTKLEASCLSSSWMTNINEAGDGYITAELAGVPESGHLWGKWRKIGDFLDLWHSPVRRGLYERLAAGTIKVPLVNRTSPVHFALKTIKELLSGFVDVGLAREVIEAASQVNVYRSRNGNFV